ncbi:sugar phosphate isomerase/epimerase family protein [Pseudoalteromonas arabiensis]|uniref:sugar phosphate isomerase/epimerase family protein n=1 Tax=Pseudoalteromonas arabiensis TaxID=874454 RepID=UPI00078268BF|nr:sugar phosphate isomerase/epimerase [Pseudoalteromonas arabiensis]
MFKTRILLLIFSLVFSGQLFAKLPVSVQLWSVKDTLKNDFHGTLKSLAEMGFDGVEFAGDFGPYSNNPAALRAKLSEFGLVASSAHIGFDALSENTIDSTLLFYKTLGVNTLYIPWDERAWHPEGVKSLVKELTKVSDYATRFDMKIGFHNHNKEFNAFNNATFWDYIATNTPKTMPLQLDIGWVNYADKDPIYFIKKYPNRTLATHIKVRTIKGSNMSPIIGENNIDWSAIIDTLESHGDTKWLVMEQEEYPNGLTPLQSVAKSKQNLDKILQHR